MIGNLRDALAPETGLETVEVATVTALNADGTLGVDFGGRVADPVPALDTGWVPAEGMAVACVRMGGSWLVLGPTRSANATTAPVDITFAFPFDVLPAATVVPSPLVVSATATGSWRPRGPGGWMQSDVRQGAVSTAWGYYDGLWFYGSGAFASLEGQTATSLTIRVSRPSSGGVGAPEPLYIAPHVHPTQPGGAPYFPVAPRKYPGPAWGGTSTITLGTDWGQGLIDGKYAGLGLRYSGTADYVILNSVSTDALSGQLTLGFS